MRCHMGPRIREMFARTLCWRRAVGGLQGHAEAALRVGLWGRGSTRGLIFCYGLIGVKLCGVFCVCVFFFP